VYVDNDPLVLTYARALLASGPHGTTAYLDADLRDTDAILEQAAGTLDFTRPIGILLIGILQLIEDTDAPQAIVRRLLDAVPSGSWLGIAHPASDVIPEVVTMAWHLSQRSVTPTTLRTHAEISRFFDGLELLPPGVVQLHHWEPGAAAPETGQQVPCLLRARSQALIRDQRGPGVSHGSFSQALDLLPAGRTAGTMKAFQRQHQREQRLRARRAFLRPGDLLRRRGEKHMQHPRRGQPPELRISRALDRRHPRALSGQPTQDAHTIAPSGSPSPRSPPNRSQTSASRHELRRRPPCSPGPLPLSGLLGLPP